MEKPPPNFSLRSLPPTSPFSPQLSSRPSRVSHPPLTRRKPAHNMENVAFSPPRSSLMLPSPAAHQQPLSHKRATPRIGTASAAAASSGGPSRAEQEADVEAAGSHATPITDGDLDQPLLGELGNRSACSGFTTDSYDPYKRSFKIVKAASYLAVALPQSFVYAYAQQ